MEVTLLVKVERDLYRVDPLPVVHIPSLVLSSHLGICRTSYRLMEV